MFITDYVMPFAGGGGGGAFSVTKDTEINLLSNNTSLNSKILFITCSNKFAHTHIHVFTKALYTCTLYVHRV